MKEIEIKKKDNYLIVKFLFVDETPLDFVDLFTETIFFINLFTFSEAVNKLIDSLLNPISTGCFFR